MADKETVIAAMKCIINLETTTVNECKKNDCVYAGKDCMNEVIKDAYKLLSPAPEEYILRSEAINALCQNCRYKNVCTGADRNCNQKTAIEAIPAAEVEPIVYGEWVERFVVPNDGWDGRRFYCSVCGDWQTYGKTQRCNGCGAHMKVV